MRTLKLSLLLIVVVGASISSCSSNTTIVRMTDTTFTTPTTLPAAISTFAPEPTHIPTTASTNTPISTISKTRINLSAELYLDENSSPDNLKGESYHADRSYFHNFHGNGYVYHFGNEEWVVASTSTRVLPFADFKETPQPSEDLHQFYVQVWRDRKLTFSFPVEGIGYEPKELLHYKDHWIFWYMHDWDNRGRIVQDGVLLNDLYDYDNAFSLFLLDGKPFFFFQRGDQFWISFNNQEILLPYTNIFYGPVCCEGLENWNPRGTDIMVGFRTQRDNSNYQYIEIGLR